MAEHRWSGWPGAWCLDCGIEGPTEAALADGNYIEVPDDSTPLGFRFDFPELKLTECPEPGSNRHNPYHNRKLPE